jgi:tetratricopeptide (TPR) repeat protein
MSYLPAVHGFLLACIVPALLSPGCGVSESEGSDIPITTASSEARAFFLEGRAAFDVGRYDDAGVMFDKAIAADTTFALACFYRARTATTPADWKLHADLAKRFAPSVSEGERLLISMLHAEAQGDLPRQTLLARQLKNRFPESPRALYEFAVVQAANKRTSEERILLEAAIDLNGLFAPALRAITSSYLFEDPHDFHEAETYATRYVIQYPEEADAHILLGDVHRAGMQLEEARGEYTRAMMVNKSSYLAFIKRGHALTFIGLYNDARRDFARATELGIGPAKVRAANFRSHTWIYAGELKKALEENETVLNSLPLLGFDEHIDFQPYMDTWLNRFLISLEISEFEVAETALARYSKYARTISLQINIPNYPQTTESEIALLEGRLALKRGDYIAASGHAARSIDFLRNIRSARKKENTELLLGQIEIRQENYTQALEHLSEANQDLIQVKFYQGLAFEALGREAEAQELFREVANWDFNTIEYALIRDNAVSRLR